MSLAVAFAIGGTVSALSSIFRGRSERKQLRRNAQYTREMGRFNAANAIAAARLNADMKLMLAGVNAGLASESSAATAALALKESQYNDGLQFAVGEYNARLIERENTLLWQEHDLNADIYQRGIDQDISAITASFAGAAART